MTLLDLIQSFLQQPNQAQQFGQQFQNVQQQGGIPPQVLQQQVRQQMPQQTQQQSLLQFLRMLGGR